MSEIYHVEKTIEQRFADWEGFAFGFGYGSGERHILTALKTFFALSIEPPLGHSYDYRKLETEMGPTVAWLIINALCRYDVNVIEYGSSPRFAWLTKQGEALQAFFAERSIDDLTRICTERTEDDTPCYPDTCNCGPDGYNPKRLCQNPFWVSRISPHALK